MRPLRLVMIGDGIGDRRVFPALQGIIAAHHPLQGGEFHHHFGDQIGLGQARGALCQVRVGAGERRQFARQRRHPFALVMNAAKLLMKHHIAQCVHARFQRRFQVRVPEIARVIEARRQHPLIARNNGLAAIRGLQIGDHDKMRRQGAGFRIAQGKVFLVLGHAQLDHFRRQRQKGRVHGADERHWPFGEPGDLVQQSRVWHQLQAVGFTQSRHLRLDARLARGRIHQHMALSSQDLLIVFKSCDRKRTRAHHPVAKGVRRGAQPGGLEIHPLPIQQAQNIVQRPHPAKIARAPFHRFGPGKAAHDLRHDLRQGLSRAKAGLFNDGNVKRALPVLADFAKLKACQPGAAQEPVQRLLRRADARALALFAHIGGPVRQIVDHRHQAARPGKAAHRRKGKARILQRPAQQARQVLRCAALHPRRDFFAEQFKQEFAHASPPSILTHSRAQALARSRTRAI